MNKVQVIESNGRPMFYVVPAAMWERLRTRAEDAEDIADLEAFDRADDGFRVPYPVVKAIAEGIHPVRAWRENARLTGDALASMAGVSAPYLSQIETGARKGTAAKLGKIAAALGVPLDQLLE